jgi:snapalysin
MRSPHRLTVAFLAGVLLAGAQLVAPVAPAIAAPAAEPRIVYYDTSRAQEFVAAVHQGAAIWNGSVTSVRLVPVPAGVRPDLKVVAANGWPYAVTTSLGRGTISFGRQAVNEGHFPPRIAAHEIGHILGLPDNYNGNCSLLMSGGSAGTSCTNPYPSSAEAARVDSLFGSRISAEDGSQVFRDSWPALVGQQG